MANLEKSIQWCVLYQRCKAQCFRYMVIRRNASGQYNGEFLKSDINHVTDFFRTIN